MIAILDYGVGNLFSLRSSLQQLGLQAVVTADAAALRAADRLILPGVGAFGDAMAKLTATGLVPVLKEQAAHKPLLGICLGMQLLFEKSYEYGEHAGLGFIKGEVCPLGPDLADKGLKVPQMGWNALHIVKDDPFFRYIRERIADKATRKYSGHNVHLCVLCLLDLTDWVLDKYGSVTYEVADWPRRKFFDEIKQTYITTKIFANIFILFLDCQAKWWIWDVGTDHRASVRLDERSLASGEYPYCILKPPSPDSNTTGSG